MGNGKTILYICLEHNWIQPGFKIASLNIPPILSEFQQIHLASLIDENGDWKYSELALAS